MNYTPIEIALIFGSCKTEEEVLKACNCFRYLVWNGGQKYLMLMKQLSIKRIKDLLENQQ